MAKYKSDSTKEVLGRKPELSIMTHLLKSNESELLAVIGRRRVGKTYLVKHGYSKHLCFHYTGKNEVSKEEQIVTFCNKILSYSRGTLKEMPTDWDAAFELLKKLINRKRTTKKKVVFLDELPWMASPRSGFLSAFTYFWNDWAVDQNIIVVICGSAASWMINKVVNSKGGLHNRITKLISLKPFDLAETEEYLKYKKVRLPRYQILQIYMCMGGIPYYLRELRSGESATQSIERICFNKDGVLYNEFHNLYSSLFDDYGTHLKVVKALATKRKGMTRKELISKTKLSSGGGMTRVLDELEASSFINKQSAYGKSQRSTLYRLVDEFSSFYLSFMHRNRKSGMGSWQQLSQTQKYKSWTGYAFEGIVIKHIEQVKKALGIPGLYSEESSFLIAGSQEREGFQIDLLIDRNDNAINLCEIKFYNSELRLNKRDTEHIRRRRDAFRRVSRTKKLLINTLITTYGFLPGPHALGIIDNHIDMDSLFL